MKKPHPPQFLDNLYRDMRDRRLLLPALALVVGLLAVPVLLSGHGSASPPATANSSLGHASAAADPAVVSEELGVTDYRRRLNRLQSKNPFRQQYTTDPAGAGSSTASSGSGAATASTSTSTNLGAATASTSTSTDLGAGAASTDTSSSSGPSTAGGTPTTSSPPVSSTPSSSGDSGQPPATRSKPTFHLYTYKVAVKIGEPGKLAERPEVSSLALLPSKARPILSFLEANGKQALFLVSTDVDSVKGDGHCIPRPSECQYILMRPGDKANLHYAPNGKRYNLVLEDIHAVEIGHKPPAKVSGGSADLKPKLPLLGQG